MNDTGAVSVTEYMGQTDTEENLGIYKHMHFLNDVDLLSFCYQIASGMVSSSEHAHSAHESKFPMAWTKCANIIVPTLCLHVCVRMCI